MNTMDRLAAWKDAGIITEAQHITLASLTRKERFSLFVEINALLYLGVISLVGGLAWTFKTHFANLGDGFILTALTAMFAGSMYYCFSRGPVYSNEEVESPNVVFDYVLYLGCLILSVELGYIEFRFQLLQSAWDSYLLMSAAVFFFLAYRFDNRFVLSLALSSLAGWFGLRVSRFGFRSSDSLRICAFIYGAVVLSSGTWLYRAGIKKHFLDTYLHVAANVLLMAAVSGVADRSNALVYLAVLILLSGTAVILGYRYTRFPFVAYGIVYTDTSD